MATKKSTDTVAKPASKTASKSAKKGAATKTPAKKSAAAEKTPEKKMPTHQEISHLAHEYWKERGHDHGSHEEDWHRAEQELKSRS